MSASLTCVLIDKTPLKVRQKTKKPTRTGEQEILQLAAMTVSGNNELLKSEVQKKNRKENEGEAYRKRP